VMLTGREAGDLGHCLEKSGRPDQAIPYLERGLQASPGHYELRQSLDRATAWTVSTD